MNFRLIGLVAVSVGIYVVASVCAVQISIHRKSKWDRIRKKFSYSVTNIAHRGGALLGPENTMYTFKQGVVEGCCDMIELDVWESKDGRIVVSHDKALGRACGDNFNDILISDIVVGSNPTATLPQSRRRIPLEFRTHDIKNYEATSDVPVDDTTRVCLLQEVLEGLPDVPLHIDIKDTKKEVVTKVFDMIAHYKRENNIFVGSSQSENEGYIREYFKQRKASVRKRYRVFPSLSGVLWIHFLFFTGLLPFVPLEFDVVSIPVFTSTMRSQMYEEYGPMTARITVFLLSAPTLWKYLQTRGVAVVGWVVNDDVDFEEAIQLPLNGLMSDNPLKFHKFLNSHKEISKLVALGV
ncbi:putative glycerophosphoryl diester phosphodiesterase [Leptomonas pyrrhocoris]|uniref:Putative glycerophosphoryl diester phosphodiesterase n=1 Tax=Leptomonas pyrrhocoris TaxID=157538 RepID=A0A0M9G8W5_LEPPY|nr:putative glycerophosphoryl diester phosphodiesterase [Leptomonas pyrrhocoris]KPA85220.1 putative glycerophosphoryl diester phosphodiesterase [Leptomonas pyrrhocoris]|eukprot:XP_015663659.1 putative glycerophosphoryl diester phosphodiesterase [Leptomonas pyrrhocoris]